MASAPTRKTPKAPVAERITHPMVSHGHTRQDPYYWLRDDTRTDEKILAYLKAENTYTTQMLATPKRSKRNFSMRSKGASRKTIAPSRTH